MPSLPFTSAARAAGSRRSDALHHRTIGRRRGLRMIGGALAAVVSATPTVRPVRAAEDALLLLDPTTSLEPAWEHQRFEGETRYTRTTVDGMPAIRAVGQRSASGLYREVSWRLADLPWLTWRWRVDRLQPSADIRIAEKEDFAAAIFLIFQEPLLLVRDTLALSYVWTSGMIRAGAIVDSPHHPGTVRNIVLEGGTDRLGQWVEERRNVVEDYRRAFGEAPPAEVKVVALFTDNDQTGEPVEAYYGAIQALRRA